MAKIPPTPPGSARRDAALALAVGLISAALFGARLDAEPHFVDESAYIATSYYADLFLDGRRDDRAWLDFPAIDQPPLSRYLVGLSLRAAGYPRPGPAEAAAWYRNTHHRPEDAAMLRVARLPSVLLGALGCVAIFAIGTLAVDRRVGLLAAAALALNPLYAMHARRAMADVHCEAFVLASAAVGLRAWKRSLSGRIGPVGWAASGLGSGILAGLATLVKLTGGLAAMVLVGWAGLAALVPRIPTRRRAAFWGVVATALVAASGTFVASYPTLTARPAGPLPFGVRAMASQGIPERLNAIYHQRLVMADGQRAMFKHNALWDGSDRLKVVLAQGYGRFGPFGPRRTDSRIRFDRAQDLGALLWAPWVAFGAIWAFDRGLRQVRAGVAPTWWALLLQAAIGFGTVAFYIPLAWDRYFLPIQSGSALLAAGLAAGAFDGLAALRVRKPRADET